MTAVVPSVNSSDSTSAAVTATAMATKPRARAAKPRAARIAAPGAPRVTLNGILAVPDNYGRLRLLLLNTHRDGSPDYSAATLRGAVPCPHAGYRLPYELTPSPDGDEVQATVWLVPPAHHRVHWQGVAAELRGQWVTVEATVRRFSIVEPSRGAAYQGTALDLAMLAPMNTLESLMVAGMSRLSAGGRGPQ